MVESKTTAEGHGSHYDEISSCGSMNSVHAKCMASDGGEKLGRIVSKSLELEQSVEYKVAPVY